MKTVFPTKEPRYFLRACSVVIAAKGNDAASLKERDFGLCATRASAHMAYSLHDPGNPGQHILEQRVKTVGLGDYSYLETSPASANTLHLQP